MPELLGRLQSALADRYRLDREGGAGSMATVYLAQDIRHGSGHDTGRTSE
jgi:hypothetical protein